MAGVLVDSEKPEEKKTVDGDKMEIEVKAPAESEFSAMR